MGRSTEQLLNTTPSSLSGSQRLDSVLAYQWFGLAGPISLSADSLPALGSGRATSLFSATIPLTYG